MVVSTLLVRAKGFIKERYALARLQTWMAVLRAVIAGAQAAVMILTMGMYIWLSFTKYSAIDFTAFLLLPNLLVTSLMLDLAINWDKLPSIPSIVHGTVCAFIGFCCSVMFLIYFGGVATKSADVFTNASVELVEDTTYIPLLLLWIGGFVFVLLQLWNLVFFPAHIAVFFYPPAASSIDGTLSWAAKWFSPLALFNI